MFRYNRRKKKTPIAGQSSSGRKDFCRLSKTRFCLVACIGKLVTCAALGAFLVILVTGVILYLIKSWDGKETLSVAFNLKGQIVTDEQVFLVAFSPGENSLAVVAFPEEMRIETIGNYGLWRVGAIYALGALEQVGGELLQKSLSQYLGTEVEGFINLDEPVSFSPDSLKADLASILWQLMLKKGDTNLSYGDLFFFWLKTGRVLPSRIKWQRLANSGILTAEFQPDGSKMYFSHPDLLNKLSSDYFSEVQMRREEKPVIIFNATEHTGLGSQAGRLIQNLGGDLIAIHDNEQKLAVSEIVVASQETADSFSLRKFKKLFGVSDAIIDPQRCGRAEILLVLGDDYWEELNSLK